MLTPVQWSATCLTVHNTRERFLRHSQKLYGEQIILRGLNFICCKKVCRCVVVPEQMSCQDVLICLLANIIMFRIKSSYLQLSSKIKRRSNSYIRDYLSLLKGQFVNSFCSFCCHIITLIKDLYNSTKTLFTRQFLTL